MKHQLVLMDNGNIIAESGRYGRYTNQLESKELLVITGDTPLSKSVWNKPGFSSPVQPVKWYVRLWNYLKGLSV